MKIFKPLFITGTLLLASIWVNGCYTKFALTKPQTTYVYEDEYVYHDDYAQFEDDTTYYYEEEEAHPWYGYYPEHVYVYDPFMPLYLRPDVSVGVHFGWSNWYYHNYWVYDYYNPYYDWYWGGWYSSPWRYSHYGWYDWHWHYHHRYFYDGPVYSGRYYAHQAGPRTFAKRTNMVSRGDRPRGKRTDYTGRSYDDTGYTPAAASRAVTRGEGRRGPISVSKENTTSAREAGAVTNSSSARKQVVRERIRRTSDRVNTRGSSDASRHSVTRSSRQRIESPTARSNKISKSSDSESNNNKAVRSSSNRTRSSSERRSYTPAQSSSSGSRSSGSGYRSSGGSRSSSSAGSRSGSSGSRSSGSSSSSRSRGRR